MKERAEELTEEAKKQYRIYELKTKFQKWITELGGKVYELSSKAGNPISDVTSKLMINRIKKLEKQLLWASGSYREKNRCAQGGCSGFEDETIKKQRTATEEAFKKQSNAIDKIAKETEVKIQRSMFNALMATIRGNVLRVKVELVAKNIGTSKNELELISETFEKAKTLATDKNMSVIDKLQGILRKAKAEIDTDLPSAINRIDLLWNEMSKLLRKA